MKHERQVTIAVYIATLSLVVSAVSTTLAAYQTFLTRESFNLARVSNVQQRQIAACEEIVRINPAQRLRNAGVPKNITFADNELEVVASLAYQVTWIMHAIGTPPPTENSERSVGYDGNLDTLPIHLDELRGVSDLQFGEILLSTRKAIDHYLILRNFSNILYKKNDKSNYTIDSKIFDVISISNEFNLNDTDLAKMTLNDFYRIRVDALKELNAQIDDISKKCQIIMFGKQ